MKRFVKIIALILSLLCIFSLVSCMNGGDDDKDDGKKTSASKNDKNDKNGACAHDYGEWTVSKRADCQNDGLKVRECSKCGNTENEIIPVTEHQFGEYTVTKAATCKTSGTKTGTCVICQKKATETIPKAEHNYGTNGSAKKCSVCGEANYSLGTQGLLFTLQGGNDPYLNTYKVSVGTAVTATEIIIPSTYKGVAVTYIEEDGFSALTKLTSINIPSSVKKIGDYAFSYCEKLGSIGFQSGSQLQSIGEAAFKGCVALTSVKIPASVMEIEKLAFYGCSELNGIYFDDESNWYQRYLSGTGTAVSVADTHQNANILINNANISYYKHIEEPETDYETGRGTSNPWEGYQTDGWGW